MGILHRVKRRGRIVLLCFVLVLVYVVSLRVFDPRVPLNMDRTELAASEAAAYLARHLDADGRFEYLVRTDDLPVPNQYNVLRHAGTIYGLGLYHDISPKADVREAILRASRYLLRHHLRPVPKQAGMGAIFSLPGEEVEGPVPQLKLGGSGLGLIALIKARQLDPERVPLETLREVGRFILFMQEPSGRFRSKYDANGQFVNEESMYYSGEAMLALSLLHKLDPDPRWLDAVLKGISYVEQSRKGIPVYRLPSDHWLMLATAEVLPQYEAATAPPILRQRILEHALAIGRMMMREQSLTFWVPGMNGSFVGNGGVTSSSTRLEGLTALYRSLPHDHPERPRIRKSVEDGLRFVLGAQVKAGKAKGGFRGLLRKQIYLSREDNLRQGEVRIDYVQHALSALVAYEQLLIATEP